MAKSKYSDETKLKAIGMIHGGTPLKEIGEELGVAYPKLLIWRKELQASIDNNDLASLQRVGCRDYIDRSAPGIEERVRIAGEYPEEGVGLFERLEGAFKAAPAIVGAGLKKSGAGLSDISQTFQPETLVETTGEEEKSLNMLSS